MLVFPQLVSGTPVQYPVIKRLVYRTVIAGTPGLEVYRTADPEWTRIEWRLAFRGIGDLELERLEQFYEEVRGSLKEFTFLDPTGNLLAWSEDFTRDVWIKTPGLVLEPGRIDPLGGRGAVRVLKAASGEDEVWQSLAAPAWFHYCFTIYAKSTSGAVVELFSRAGTWEQGSRFRLGSEWLRLSLATRGSAVAEQVSFGLRLAEGEVDIFGAQVEPQPAPSSYRKTGSRGGVYEETRFGNEPLVLTSVGPDNHSGRVTLITRLR